MTDTSIDRLYREFRQLKDYLATAGEASFLTVVDDNSRKALLLAAASYFEDRICADIADFVHETTQQNQLVVSFVKNKAISRQYHQFFTWDANNANTFFGLFGEGFREHMKAEIKRNPDLEQAVKAFLEIGNERNRLVHQNYSNYSLEKTADEIYHLYSRALPFVKTLPGQLRQVK